MEDVDKEMQHRRRIFGMSVEFVGHHAVCWLTLKLRDLLVD
jgi:hypothetical protein